ncbi:MAG: hypothetical protein ACOYJJ_01960 [Anaerovoracaceae bacterium]
MADEIKKKELKHFMINGEYGGDQDWFLDPMMHLGGCAAETACDSSLYFALHLGIPDAYPYDPDHLTKKDYVRFSGIMKPYISPRFSGVNRLDIYIDGFASYLADRGVTEIGMEELPGELPAAEAWDALVKQIDGGLPVPCLILNHNDPEIRKEYQWHWFLLNGYRETKKGHRLVKAVTYGEYQWVDFDRLWNTGYAQKGGLVLYRREKIRAANLRYFKTD